MLIVSASTFTIRQAADLLCEGKLVAFPTETVYGLGGDATNDRAISAIYAAKGRPQFNPLIIHVTNTAQLSSLVIWNEQAEQLAAHFWPGPLTLILPRTENCAVSLLASAGLSSLAVRIPSHPVAQELLRTVGRPIAAPSANASGKLSPTTPAHVAESLNGKIDMILAAGRTTVGLESTVIDLTGDQPTMLRPGGITTEQIEAIIGPIKIFQGDSNEPHSPGQLASHYAPNLPLRLNAEKAEDDEALLCFGSDFAIKGGAVRLNLSPTSDLTEAAANLFAMLRALDQPEYRSIAVMPIPDTGLGLAINDRLQRAASPRN